MDVHTVCTNALYIHLWTLSILVALYAIILKVTLYKHWITKHRLLQSN